jgi:hypothetical protein
MTDDELKALVASLAVDSKNMHEAQSLLFISMMTPKKKH